MKKFLLSLLVLFSSASILMADETSLTPKTVPDPTDLIRSTNLYGDNFISTYAAIKSDIASGGGSQTPWSSAIDGGGYNLTNTGNIGVGTTTVASGDIMTLSGGNLRFKGTAARTIGLNRETTAATAGHDLTIDAGGGKSGGTDLAGGDLILKSGQSTGTAQSYVRIRVPSSGTASGTTENTPVDRVVVVPGKTIVNNTDTDMFKIDISGNTSCGGSFAWETSTVDAGLDYQISSGVVNYAVYNKSGTFGMDIVKMASDALASSAGTLTNTFKLAQVGTDLVVRINHTSSLTAASGHPRLQYTVFNNCYKNITICEGNTCP